MEDRIAEGEKMGFKEVFITAHHQPFSKSLGIKINAISNLKELIAQLNEKVAKRKIR